MNNRSLTAICILLVFVSAIVLGGCGNKAAEKKTIHFMTWAGGGEAAKIQVIIDAINAKNSDFQIVHEPSPNDYPTKLMTSLSGGSAADLLWIGSDDVPTLSEKGALMDITDRLKADKTNKAANLSDYFPNVLKIAEYNGKYYGLPWIASPLLLFYNKDLFDKAGVSYPDDTWTWADFSAAAKKLTIPGKQWGFSINNGSPPVQMYIWQTDGNVISADLKHSPIDSPQAIQALEYYFGMQGDGIHCVPKSVIQEQGFDTMFFDSHNVAMFIGGASDDLDKQEHPFNIGVAAPPKGPTGIRATQAWSALTAINAKTPEPDLAYKALLQLTEALHHVQPLPPVKSLANKESLKAAGPRSQQQIDVMLRILPDMRCYVAVPKQQEWNDTWAKEVLEPMSLKGANIPEIAKRARIKLEQFLIK
ncbi:MAG: sugar ABC transporter substrate-binding protein [Negativicutes bacterium]|jgi:multiple sugar transport system substrate-binding protein